MKRFLFLFFAFLVLFFCDAISKYGIVHYLPLTQISSCYPYGGIGLFQNFFGIDFCITRVFNKGGAWGLFASASSLLLLFRIIFVFGLLIYAFFFNKSRSKAISLLLILTGAIGNIVDCFIYGAVIDMLHFVLWGYSFPVFNLADVMIFLGVTSLLVQTSLCRKKARFKQLKTPILPDEY